MCPSAMLKLTASATFDNVAAVPSAAQRATRALWAPAVDAINNADKPNAAVILTTVQPCFASTHAIRVQRIVALKNGCFAFMIVLLKVPRGKLRNRLGEIE